MQRYLANTSAEQRAMLDVIGAASIEELLSRVPARARLARPLALPAAAAEMDLIAEMRALAARNADADGYTGFLGGGSDDHFGPGAVNHMVLRGGFFTPYS